CEQIATFVYLFLDRLRIAPAAVRRNQLVGFERSPCVRLVLEDRCLVSQNRIDDAPGGFDAVLPREQGQIPPDRVAERRSYGGISSAGRWWAMRSMPCPVISSPEFFTRAPTEMDCSGLSRKRM